MATAAHKYGHPGRYAVSLTGWAGNNKVRGNVRVGPLRCPVISVLEGITAMSWALGRCTRRGDGSTSTQIGAALSNACGSQSESRSHAC